MLTYENFITNLFIKKSPGIFIELGQALTNILKEYYIIIGDDSINVRMNLSKLSENCLTIHSDYLFPKNDKDLNNESLVFELTYWELSLFDIQKKDRSPDSVEIMLLSKIHEDFTELRNFLDHILERILIKELFHIPLDKVQSVIDEMTIENLEEFLDSKKYNL